MIVLPVGGLGWLTGGWLAFSLLAGPHLPPPRGREVRVAIFLSKPLLQPIKKKSIQTANAGAECSPPAAALGEEWAGKHLVYGLD